MRETQYEKYYITEDGTVYSFKRKERKKLKTFLSKKGYEMVRLYSNGKVKFCTVHRLVALAFIDNPNSLEQVNHKDGNKRNNNVNNLEWATCQENIDHAHKIGLYKHGEKHSRAVHSDEFLLKLLKEIEAGKSVKRVAKENGISQSYLNKVKNGVYRKNLKKE